MKLLEKIKKKLKDYFKEDLIIKEDFADDITDEDLKALEEKIDKSE